jgi:hypothetical protein
MDYQKIYNQIVERAKKECRKKNNGVYYEAHHIVPRCLGGTGSNKEWRTHPNIVLLTAREHFLCHWLLHELYPLNNSLAVAFSMMCLAENNQQSRYRPSSRIIENAKLKLSEIKKSFRHTDEAKRKISHALSNRPTPSIETIQKRITTRMANGGYGWSDETRKKQIMAKTGKKHSVAARLKMSEVQLNSWKTRGDERRKAQSLKMKGRSQQIMECPFCKTKGGNTMKRWHFENCKLKLNNNA